MSLQVTVKLCDREVAVTVGVETAVADVKNILAGCEDVAAADFDLRMEGSVLADDEILVQKGIQDGHELEAIPNLRALALLKLRPKQITISNFINEASRGGDLTMFYVHAGIAYDSEQYQETALLSAIGNGHLHTVKELIQCYREGDDIETKINQTAESPLARAAKNGRVEIIEFLLTEPAIDINHKGQSSLGNALYCACENGYFDIARLLIANGATIDNAGPHNSTPLLAASYGGYLSIVKLLLVHNSSINHQNTFHETPLFSAASNGHTPVVQFLISEGAAVNDSNNVCETPLFKACSRGHVRAAGLLIDAATDCNIKTKYKETALMVAASTGGVELVRKMASVKGIELDAQNSRGETALHYAAIHGHAEVVKELLTIGINAKTKSARGETALLSSLCSGVDCLAVVKELTRDTSCLELSDSVGHTPLIRASQLQLQSIVNHLLEQKANVAATSVSGDTPLWYSVCNSNYNIVSLLLEHGALKHPFHKELTPLARACNTGNSGIVELLLSFGANPNEVACKKQQSPLMKATSQGNVEIVKLLLRAGAAVDHCDKEGNTALHIACLAGNVVLTKLLVENKANIDVVNCDVETPLVLAIMSCKPELISLLLENTTEIKANYVYPLHKASSLGIPSIVKMVMTAIPHSVNVSDCSGETPLFHAVRSQDIQTIDLLIDEGKADVNHRNECGETALFSACIQRHYKVAIYLMKRGASPNIPNYKNKLPSDLVKPHSAPPMSAFFRDEDIFLSNTLLSKLKEVPNDKVSIDKKSSKRKMKKEGEGCCVIC